MRKRVRAKFSIARAAMPMFSPSCGSTRMTMGPARSKHDLVLSVPEPDILTSLSDSRTEKALNQVPKNLIQHLSSELSLLNHEPPRLPVRENFSSNIIGLVKFSDTGSNPECNVTTVACARSPIG